MKGGAGHIEVEADLWVSDWRRGGALLEETRYLPRWDQTLTLLWFEDEEVPQEHETGGDMGPEELDGLLPWPGKKRRRRSKPILSHSRHTKAVNFHQSNSLPLPYPLHT